jgi:4-hydroxybenzoate polyprenyltransferase
MWLGAVLCHRFLSGKLYSNQNMGVPAVDQSTPDRELSQQYGGDHTGRWVNRLPSWWIPYVQLARLSPPVGLFLIYLPHVLGIILAAILQRSTIFHVLRISGLILGWSFFFSNAAHGWNDIVDLPIDKMVTRTRKRPIPRGAISRQAAFVFVVSQAIGAGASLMTLPPKTTLYTVPNILTTIYYPYAKQHTNFAQVILGFCLAWGVLSGTEAMGLDPLFETNMSPLFLFLACVLWTILYDTIYAHQDVEDDVRIGIKSTAVLFSGHAKPFLCLVLGSMLVSLVACGRIAGLGHLYYSITVGGTAISMSAIIANVDLKSSSSCWSAFRYGFWFTGASLVGGLLSEYVWSILGVLWASHTY